MLYVLGCKLSENLNICSLCLSTISVYLCVTYLNPKPATRNPQPTTRNPKLKTNLTR